MTEAGHATCCSHFSGLHGDLIDRFPLDADLGREIAAEVGVTVEAARSIHLKALKERRIQFEVGTAHHAVTLRVRLIDDERTPEGMVCMATYHDTRLIARYVMPPEMWAQVSEHNLFGSPVPVVLVAREAAPGLQCQLYALLQLPPGLTEDEPDEEAEPWASSVPGASYDAVVEGEQDDDEISDQLVAFPLGHIVRFDRDRVHPGNLPLEAADILRRLIEGKTTEVVDKALEDLLGD